MSDSQHSHRIPLLLSMPQACSYLDNESSSSAFVDPDMQMDMQLYGQLLRAGFRRSGKLVYRPHCAECQQCRSVRIPVEDFYERRRYRRIRRKNADVRLVSCNARLQPEHYALYQKYTAARHGDGSMAESTPEQYIDFLSASWSDTHFIELREHDRLLGVAVTDQVSDGLSAVYTFFDPDMPERSLGIWAILSQIQMARQLELTYLYLGYWIRNCEKMRYKADFRPLEVFSQGTWRRFEDKQAVEIPEITGIGV